MRQGDQHILQMVDPGARQLLGVEEAAAPLAQIGGREQFHRHRGQLAHLESGMPLPDQRLACASKAWKAWPASCSRVDTSSTTPTAFMKMNGRPR